MEMTTAIGIVIVIKFIKMCIDRNLVVYTLGRSVRVGDPAYHEGGIPFNMLSFRQQYKIAERALREYRHADMSDKEFVKQCSANPYWTLSFYYDEAYASELVNGECAFIDEDGFYDDFAINDGEEIIDEDAFYESAS